MNSKDKATFSTNLNVWLSNLSKTGRSSKQAVAVSVDTCLVIMCLWAAYSLRYGYAFSDFSSTWHIFFFVPVGTVIIFMSLGIYRWVIRSSSANLTNQLFKASICASLFLVIFVHLIPAETPTPRSLFVIFGMLLLITTSGIRLLWQELFDSGKRGEPVAIYGAGQAGRQLMRSFEQGAEFCPVLFLDDSPMLGESMVGGIPVVAANLEGLESQLLAFEVERVILAMPSIDSVEYEQKVDLLRKTGVVVQTVPTHSELVAGTASVGEVRDISITDLLGRNEVPPNPVLLSQSVNGRTVLVTGGGGSIGSELCRQILKSNPSKLVIVDHSEENLYRVTEEFDGLLAEEGNQSIVFKPILCSVTDRQRMENIVENHEVETIFHAAAYKHVPIVEAQPEQGVMVNVFGTLSILDAALKHGVKDFVLISTDKAVRPTNSMGASKRVAELILQAKARMSPGMKISMVRFGNVLGSSGSVVPKFKKQISEGGPITLTHPNITRYFMTIPEAAQLVLQASAIADGGDVFVLDMGKPHRIEDLAVSMVKMSGKKLRRDTGVPTDIEIVVEGLRPGEKMYEELFISGECKSTCVPKVNTAEESSLDWSGLQPLLKKLEFAMINCDRKSLKNQLMDLAFNTQEDFDLISAGEAKKISVSGEEVKLRLL